MIPRIVSYVEQEDFHLPTLTVRETVEFAHACYSAPEKYVAQHYGEEIVHLSKHRVSALLKVSTAALLLSLVCLPSLFRLLAPVQTLGLEGCADVRVGNETIRGVSGGQRHRLTLAEMSVGNHRVLLLDQISTGLDTAVTVDICKSITALAKVLLLPLPGLVMRLMLCDTIPSTLYGFPSPPFLSFPPCPFHNDHP